LPIPG
jgi:Cupin domain